MSSNATVKEPFLRIAKRDGVKKSTRILTIAVSILVALIVDAVFIFLVTGLNPFSVYGVMFKGTFGNKMRFSWALRDLSGLLIVGIALAPAFKMKFWNIGAEGQILIGGIATASSASSTTTGSSRVSKIRSRYAMVFKKLL